MSFVLVALGLELGGAGPEGAASLARELRPAIGSVLDNFDRPALGSNWNVHVGNPGIISGTDLGLLTGSIAILSWSALRSAVTLCALGRSPTSLQ